MLHRPSTIALQTSLKKVRFLSTTTATGTSATVEQRLQTPNRFTRVYTKMQETCPDAIRAYATCVSVANETGNLAKGVCDSEFKLVKDCFRTVRIKQQQETK